LGARRVSVVLAIRAYTGPANVHIWRSGYGSAEGAHVSPAGDADEATRALECRRLALGSTGFGGMPASAAVALVHEALQCGVDMFDTADVYGRSPGDSESLLGEAIGATGNNARISTKVGLRVERNGKVRVDNSRDWIIRSCESSLVRLQRDCIDLYILHRRHPKMPIEQTVAVLAELAEQGMVRQLGLSEVSATTLRRAAAVFPIAALQVEYSVLSRDPEREILTTCSDLNIDVYAYRPLARGLLAAKYQPNLRQSALPDAPRFSRRHFRHNLALVGTFSEICRELDCSPAQVAISWIWDRSPSAIPVFSTTSVQHLHEVWAARRVRLKREHKAALDVLAAMVKGDRYSAAQMRLLDA